MQAHSTAYSPLSPMERELTSEMFGGAGGSTQHDANATSTTTTPEFPRNTSSWELLDVVGNDAAAHGTTVGVVLCAMPATVAPPAETVLPPVVAQTAPFATTSTTTTTTTLAAAAVVAEQEGASAVSGRVSPANTVCSAWSRVSTPSEGRRAAAAVQPTQLPFRTDGVDDQRAAALPTDDAGKEDERAGRRLCRGSLAVSQTFSIASPPPSPVPAHVREVTSLTSGWSATSYEEVFMSGAHRQSRQGSGVVSAGVSTCCTVPSPHRHTTNAAPLLTGGNGGSRPVQHGARVGLSGEQCLLALPPLSDPRQQQQQEEECEGLHGVVEMQPHTPTTEQLMAWLANVGTTLPDGAAVATVDAASAKGGVRCSATTTATTTWTARRISFLSSSSAAAVTVSATLLAHASLPPGFTEMTSPLPVPAPAAFAAPSPAVSPTCSPSLTKDLAMWWSRARMTCADGSQQALRGLNRLCGYVWTDLKHHWYPQLRLVLGDHTCVQKTRRRRSRHRIAPRASAGMDGQWRSVSAPCLVSGDVRTCPELRRGGRRTLAERWSRHDTGKSNDASRSTRGGIHVCIAMTADAVASAAQGLLVFLL